MRKPKLLPFVNSRPHPRTHACELCLQCMADLDVFGGVDATQGSKITPRNTNPRKDTMATKKERAVLVTTEYRGVFFGYATITGGNVINLKRARNCIYWSADVKGFLGLASTGPSKGCKIGPPADIELRKITCVAEMTPTAVAAWENAPWG